MRRRDFSVDCKALDRSISVHSELYGGTNELLATVSSRGRNEHYKNYRDHYNDPDPDFSGVGSRSEGEKYLKYGYDATLQRVKTFVDDSLCGERIGIGFKKDVCGGTFNVADYLNGIPECFRRKVKTNRGANVLQVIYDIGTCAGTDKKAIEERGFAVLNAVARCESAGKRIELYCCDGYTGDKTCDFLAVKIKDAGDMFDAKRVAFGTTCPGFFRWLGFAWFERFPGGRDLGYGLGRPFHRCYNVEARREIIKKIFGHEGIYIYSDQMAGTLDGCASQEDIKEEACKLVKQINRASKQFIQN